MDLRETNELLNDAVCSLNEGQRTYKQTMDYLFNGLRDKGWKTSNPSLKIRHATSPDGYFRAWFKKQAVYYTREDHSFRMARTMTYADLRPASIDEFLGMVSHLRRPRNI